MQSAARLSTLFQEQNTAFSIRKAELEEQRQTLTHQHKAERQKLRDTQNLHWQHKQREWKKQFNKGIRGLFDRITGKRRKIEERIEQDAYHVKTHQKQERDKLVFNQLTIRRTLQSRIKRLEALKSHRLDELEHDISQYQDMREQRLEQFEVQRQKQNRDRPKSRQRGPDWTR